jgi:hypothetical protein
MLYEDIFRLPLALKLLHKFITSKYFKEEALPKALYGLHKNKSSWEPVPDLTVSS